MSNLWKHRVSAVLASITGIGLMYLVVPFIPEAGQPLPSRQVTAGILILAGLSFLGSLILSYAAEPLPGDRQERAKLKRAAEEWQQRPQ